MLYGHSTIVTHFFSNVKKGIQQGELSFFSIYHPASMVIAITLITIGSAKAKREVNGRQKFEILLTWFVAALLLIFLAIPWPFSPFVVRPYFRAF